MYAEWTRELSESELKAVLDDAKRTGILLVKSPNRDLAGSPGCWLGGEPNLPPEIDWPYFEENGVPLAPMHFLAQINLAELPPEAAELGLPESGTLFFFYDTIYAPLGWLDRGGSKVIYVAEDVSGVPFRPTPEMPEVDETSSVSHWYADRPTKRYRRWNISFRVFESINRGEFNQNAEQALLDRTDDIYKGLKQSLIDGFAADPACRRPAPNPKVSFLFGGSDIKAARGRIPLLTLEDDPDIDFEHACAILTFWIEEEHLRQRRFDQVTLTER